jgi:hypothetical protein
MALASKCILIAVALRQNTARGTRSLAMRAAAVFLTVLLFSGAAAAQTWTHYVNRDYRFTINFPGQPAIQDAPFTTARGTRLPAKLFLVQNAAGRYAVTVVDYSRAPAEEEGAIAHAASLLRKGRVVYDEPYTLAGIPGHSMSTVAEDGSRTLGAVNFHDHRLYIVEGTVPAGAAPPVQFQQSIVVIRADGQRRDLRENFDPLAPPPLPPETSLCY